MDVVEEAINVHGGPGQRANTRAESAFEVIDVRSKERPGVRADLVHNTDSLAYDVLELVVVVLEFVFLEEHNLGALWDFNANSGKAFGLTDEGHDLTIKVDVKLKVLVVTDEESSLESSLCSINFLLPFFTPHVLVGEQGVTERVVVSDVLSDVVGSLLDQLWGELLHGHGDPEEQMARPGDSAGDRGQISHNWWLLLVLLVIVLDLLDLVTVLLEEQVVLGLEAVLERRSVEDALELAEESEGDNQVGDVGELLVNVVSEVSLDVGDVNVEFDEISVELVVTVLQESVVLALELLDIRGEFVNNVADVLKVVLLKSLELLDGAEEVNQLANTSPEKVEATEDLSRREVELFGLGHVLESLLGELVLGLVGLVEGLALLHHFDELIMGDDLSFPEDGVIESGATFLRFGGFTGDTLEVEDVDLAVDDHLVGDLHEKAGHTLVGVVVSSDGVDHLDGVHEDGEGLTDAVRCSIVEGLNEALESLEVLNVILGLVKVLGNAELDGSPVGEGEVDTGVSVLVGVALADGGKDGLDVLAVGRTDLLGDSGEHSHAEFPVLELVTRTVVLVVSLSGGLLEDTLDLLRPFLEDGHEVLDHVGVNLVGLVDSLDVLLVLFIVGFERDVRVLGLDGFLEFAAEFLKNDGKVAFLFNFAHAPLFGSDLVHKWLVDIVHDGVQGDHGVVGDLTEEDFRVVGILVVNSLASRKAAEEINSFA
jgi:hypothetical protein